jgi:hypothetical protein
MNERARAGRRRRRGAFVLQLFLDDGVHRLVVFRWKNLNLFNVSQPQTGVYRQGTRAGQAADAKPGGAAENHS